MSFSARARDYRTQHRAALAVWRELDSLARNRQAALDIPLPPGTVLPVDHDLRAQEGRFAMQWEERGGLRSRCAACSYEGPEWQELARDVSEMAQEYYTLADHKKFLEHHAALLDSRISLVRAQIGFAVSVPQALVQGPVSPHHIVLHRAIDIELRELSVTFASVEAYAKAHRHFEASRDLFTINERVEILRRVISSCAGPLEEGLPAVRYQIAYVTSMLHTPMLRGPDQFVMRQFVDDLTDLPPAAGADLFSDPQMNTAVGKIRYWLQQAFAIVPQGDRRGRTQWFTE